LKQKSIINKYLKFKQIWNFILINLINCLHCYGYSSNLNSLVISS